MHSEGPPAIWWMNTQTVEEGPQSVNRVRGNYS
jgi:hypothetical protein